MAEQQGQLSPTQLLKQLPEFKSKVDKLATLIGVPISQSEVDHIAVRINDLDVAKESHQQWLAYGEEISNNQINGRPIVVIKLNDAIPYGDQNISCVELPYPGKKSYPEQGWEHIECVVKCSATTVEELIVAAKLQFPILSEKWPSLMSGEFGLKVKMSSPKGENERLPNPTIAFKWQGVCIKLHTATLEDVIASEQ
ncbi:VOC family protein [Vibrio sp. SS-MA-C1-2]|uniref:VOC family protein n=1 Tax=Vibrio sp. SS-MA-C1-2 TaxID=2908646 RepID=UPI001F35E0B6|nr:VOC family protein [Vibrio sp. SS-MA-C1-2]UJF18637.1 VOC family protein [Vibrio sp. SS-MA-C1-2]